MTAEKLRAKIDVVAAKVKLERASYLHCDQQNSATYIQLLREKRPEVQYDPLPAMGVGVHRVQGSTLFVVGNDYWRAIAKIAFHYYLLNSPRNLQGNEAEFDVIRSFIMNGGDHGKIFDVGTKFVWPSFPSLGATVVPLNWVHMLAGEEVRTQATVGVCLFAGPETSPGKFPRIHNVLIAKLDRRIHVVQPAFGHVYTYYEADKRNAFDGEVGTAPPSRQFKS